MSKLNKYKTLLSNTLLISMGTFGSKILVFLMVRFYTGYLTPSDYSTADLITQTANLLFPIISIGITEGVFRFTMDTQTDRKSVFSMGLFSIAVGSSLFFIAAPLLGIIKEFDGFIWLIVVYTIASCLHSLCSQYIRAIGKTGLFAVQGIINTMLVILLNILFLAVLRIGVLGYVLSVVLADGLSTAFLTVKEKLWRQITLKPDKTVLKPMLKYSIPLIPTTVFWWITSVSSRYMVNGIIGSDANGIYTVSYKLPTVLTLVSTMFMQAWQFSAVTESEGNEQEHIDFYTKVWGSFQAVMFLVGSGIIAFSKVAINILTADEYYVAWKYVPFLSIAMVYTALTSFSGTVYVVKKKSVISFLTALLGAGSNILFNFLLILSPLGVQGAAISTALSYFLVFIVRGINVHKYIPYKQYWWHTSVNAVIIFSQALLMIFEVKYWIIYQIIAIALLLAVNFKFLMSFLEKLVTPIKERFRK